MSIISKKKCARVYLVPILVSTFVLILALTPVLGSMDKALYDLLLGLKEPPPVSDRLVLLDVDDIAIEKVGGWPWPRCLMADGLLTLKELGLSQMVFDIEYLNPSPPGRQPALSGA